MIGTSLTCSKPRIPDNRESSTALCVMRGGAVPPTCLCVAARATGSSLPDEAYAFKERKQPQLRHTTALPPLSME